MKKRMLAVLLLLSLAVLEACGAPQDSSEENASNDTPARPSTTGPAGEQGTETESFALPGEAVYPEGVAYDPSTGGFFIGSTRDGAVYGATFAMDRARRRCSWRVAPTVAGA